MWCHITYLAIKIVKMRRIIQTLLTLCTVPETKIAEFANSVDLDEVAHNEPPHLDLHFCPLVFVVSI